MLLPPLLQLHLTETNVPCFGTATLETMHRFLISIFSNHYVFLLVVPVGQNWSHLQLTSGGSDDTLVVKHLVVLTPPGRNT